MGSRINYNKCKWCTFTENVNGKLNKRIQTTKRELLYVMLYIREKKIPEPQRGNHKNQSLSLQISVPTSAAVWGREREREAKQYKLNIIE